MKIDQNAALVILSGGQDSTTALFWAKKKFNSVSAISFDYGQRHRVELEAAAKIAELAEVSQRIISLDSLSQLTNNALTRDTAIETNINSGLPTTFVPGRNLIFVALAATAAYDQGIPHLILGVSQVDYSGYPDCREGTMTSLQETLRLGMEFPFEIHTPLIHKTKKETVEMAQKLGIVDILAHTHTCYQGIRPGCGKCPACKLRAKGFAEAGIDDPLLV